MPKQYRSLINTPLEVGQIKRLQRKALDIERAHIPVTNRVVHRDVVRPTLFRPTFIPLQNTSAGVVLPSSGAFTRLWTSFGIYNPATDTWNNSLTSGNRVQPIGNPATVTQGVMWDSLNSTVWISEDSLVSFVERSIGDTPEGTFDHCFAVDGRWWMLGGDDVWYSDDLAQTWTPAGLAIPSSPLAICAHPTNPNKIACYYHDTVGNEFVIRYTTNRGNSWGTITFAEGVWGIGSGNEVIMWLVNNTIIIPRRDDNDGSLHILRSENLGAIQDDGPLLDNADFNDTPVDACHGDGSIFIGLFSSRILRSVDGVTWDVFESITGEENSLFNLNYLPFTHTLYMIMSGTGNKLYGVSNATTNWVPAALANWSSVFSGRTRMLGLIA